MNTQTAIILYKCLTIIIGFGVIALGYRLFRVGVFEKAGELQTAWGEGKYLLLKQAAPGTFFALFGSAILGLAVWRGITVDEGPLGTAVQFAVRDVARDQKISEAVTKALNGQALSEDERQLLREWVEVTRKRIHIMARGELSPEKLDEFNRTM